jgi:hypothetical protein
MTSPPGHELFTFHRYPAEPVRKQKWVEVVNRLNWKPSTFSVVCSKHFRPEDFEPKTEFGKKVRLKNTAVPSVGLDGSDDDDPARKWPSVKKPRVVKAVSAEDWNGDGYDDDDGQPTEDPTETVPVVFTVPPLPG